MDISSFDDLLNAARQQAEPQRLLFVFTGTELTDDSTSEQAEQFRAGQGGALIPLMCADKTADEIVSFNQLEEESRQFGHDWIMVFVAGLSGHNGIVPTTEEAEKPLERMMASIQAGTLGTFIPFDRKGHPVLFS